MPRLKDEMPNFQIIMKTSELMYSQSWVSESEYLTMLEVSSHHISLVTGPKPVMRVPGPGGESEMGGPEKYDSYLTKLQNICTEPVGEEGTVKPVTESLKSALQNISVLPTPTPT